MANVYNIDELSYRPQENPEWFTRAAFGGRLVQGGYIRVLTGIKGDELLSQIDLANKILQIDGKDCAWTPNQVIKLSEKTASIKTYKINLEQCIDELEQKRTVYQLSPGADNEELPPELEAATLALVAMGLSNEIEEMIIGGDSSTIANEFDGFQKQALSSLLSYKVPGAVHTKSNVLDLVEAVYNAVPENVLQAEDSGTLFVLCSYNTRRLIRAALADKNNQVIAAMWSVDEADKKNPRLYYLGVEIVPVKGIGRNTLIAYDNSNAFLLTDLLGDLDGIELGQFPKPQNNKIYIKGRLRLGFVIPFEDEIVVSDPSISVASGGDTDILKVTPNNYVVPAGSQDSLTMLIQTKDGVTPTIAVDTAFLQIFPDPTVAGVTTVTVLPTPLTGRPNPAVTEITITTPSGKRVIVPVEFRTDPVVTITD